MIKNGAQNFDGLPKDTQEKLKREFPRKEVRQKQELHVSKLPDILKEAKRFAKKWNKNVHNVSLEHYVDHDAYSDWGWSRVDLVVDGIETDQQYHTRLWDTYEAARVREEWERREFERLSAKFK